MATARLTGFKELDLALGKLPKTTAGNVLTRTLLKAAQPMLADAIRMAPDDPATGAPDLHTSIVAKKGRNGQKTFRRTANIMVLAPLERNQKSGKPTGLYFYSRALEMGTGDMPTASYMRPAFDQNAAQAVVIIGDELKKQIEKAAARMAKKAAKGG